MVECLTVFKNLEGVVRDYESYVGRNPKTGNNTVAPKRAPFFKTGKGLNIAMNRKQ